jgi:hypothetical protein
LRICVLPDIDIRAIRSVPPPNLPGEKKMKTLILIGLSAVGLAACSAPTLNGRSDTVQLLSGGPQMAYPPGPYDNTANSVGGRYVGGGD